MLRILACVLLLAVASAAAAVPVWGSRTSSSVDTLPSQLKPGEWIWGGDSKAMGPMAVIVSLSEQRAYVYRNGLLVAVTTVSTGKAGHETPTGVFTILQKDKDHRSSKYNSAPMPYQQRLTWDGVALHAGGLPGYPESHGCVHLPSMFAEKLFDSTNMGMTVVITRAGTSPQSLVHPTILIPINPGTGAEASLPRLDSGEVYRWHPELSPTGPVSIVLSRSDQRLIVMRNGIEIGRARIQIREPHMTGTRAYIVGTGHMDSGMPNWFTIGVPGHEGDAGMPLSKELVGSVTIPASFVALVTPLLQPGVVLLATDEHILPGTTGGKPIQVIDADPPGVAVH